MPLPMKKVSTWIFSRISVGSVFDDIARENLTGTVIDNTGRKFFPKPKRR